MAPADYYELPWWIVVQLNVPKTASLVTHYRWEMALWLWELRPKPVTVDNMDCDMLWNKGNTWVCFSNAGQRGGPASYWSAVSPSSTGSQRLCECVTPAATVSIGGSERKPGHRSIPGGHSWREKGAKACCKCIHSLSLLVSPWVDIFSHPASCHWCFWGKWNARIKWWLIKWSNVITISGLFSCVPSITVFVVVFLAAK